MLNFENIKYTGAKTHMSTAEFRQLLSENPSAARKITPVSVTQNPKTKRKYRSIKFAVGDRVFDSEKEAMRYIALSELEQKGIIRNLQLQKKYELIPTQRDENGKVIERACYYYADFVYDRCDGVEIVEDVKSKITKTPLYIVKRKLMLYRYGIQVQEVE